MRFLRTRLSTGVRLPAQAGLSWVREVVVVPEYFSCDNLSVIANNPDHVEQKADRSLTAHRQG